MKGHVSIGRTRVYRESNGRLVMQKRASGAKSYAKTTGRCPKHYVYIYDGGRVTNVYKRKRRESTMPRRRHPL